MIKTKYKEKLNTMSKLKNGNNMSKLSRDGVLTNYRDGLIIYFFHIQAKLFLFT